MTDAAIPPGELLYSIAEPSRLRLLNSLAAGPMFVSDLQAVLDLPQPTVSRHLMVLRHSGVVRGDPVGPHVLYRLIRGPRPTAALLEAILTALDNDPVYQSERKRAQVRSRIRAQAGRATA